MSQSARRLTRRERAACACGHRAVFIKPGSRGRAVAARRDHPLCSRCWRAERTSERARQMAASYARREHFVPGPFALL